MPCKSREYCCRRSTPRMNARQPRERADCYDRISRARQDDTMGDDKGVTLPDRVLSYGDTAVAQGNAATQTKVVPPPKPTPPPPVDVITLVLIDRRGLVSDGTRKALRTRLERDLNALGVVKKEPDVLKAQS